MYLTRIMHSHGRAEGLSRCRGRMETFLRRMMLQSRATQLCDTLLPLKGPCREIKMASSGKRKNTPPHGDVMKKGYSYLMLIALLGVFVYLQTGCAGRVSGYSRYPYPYSGYYWYPYSSYSYWGPYSYDSYYGYPYGGYYSWPYPSYRYRDYRYHYKPRDRYDDGLGRPRPPQSPPPDRKPPYPLKPNWPKGGERPPLDKPFLRNYQPERK
jgi:hypothetical protein